MIKHFMSNNTAQRDFERCRDMREQIATSLSDTHAFLQELQSLNMQAAGKLDRLTNGIFLFTLASQFNPNAETKSEEFEFTCS
jgi:hypothetical protein